MDDHPNIYQTKRPRDAKCSTSYDLGRGKMMMNIDEPLGPENWNAIFGNYEI